MIEPTSAARRVLLPKSTSVRIACVLVLLCIVPLLASAARYLTVRSWFLEVSFQGTVDDVSRFVAKNTSTSEQFVRIARFVVSTARFGKLDWDDFESKVADTGRFVPPAGHAEFSVTTPANPTEYLCSSLRATGFFAQYGTLKKGRLMPAGEAATITKKILEDLSCSYDVSNQVPDAVSARQMETNPYFPLRVRVPCGQVSWISNCVSQVVPFDG
jgi:hypothetical protein